MYDVNKVYSNPVQYQQTKQVSMYVIYIFSQDISRSRRARNTDRKDRDKETKIYIGELRTTFGNGTTNDRCLRVYQILVSRSKSTLFSKPRQALRKDSRALRCLLRLLTTSVPERIENE